MLLIVLCCIIRFPGYGYQDPYYTPPPQQPPYGHNYRHPPAYPHHPGHYTPPSELPPPPGTQPTKTDLPPPPGTQPTKPKEKPVPEDTPATTSYDTSTSYDTTTSSYDTTATSYGTTEYDNAYIDDEQSRQDKQRLDELLNQIDMNRGVSPGQEVVTIGGEEPNSFSEEHGDVEGDDRPPGEEMTPYMKHHEGK